MGLSESAGQASQIPLVRWKETFENVKIYKRNEWSSGRCPNTASRRPYISLLILTFFNGCISVKTSLVNTKLEDFVNIGVLILTMWIIEVAYSIIYRLVPSPFRFNLKSGNNIVTHACKFKKTMHLALIEELVDKWRWHKCFIFFTLYNLIWLLESKHHFS